MAARQPETLLLCVDVDAEAALPYRPSAARDARSRLDVVREAAASLVHLKAAAWDEHRFGVVALRARPELVLAPTSDAAAVLAALERLAPDAESHAACDLAPLAGLAGATRVVLFYARSETLPGGAEALAAAAAGGALAVDALYVHRPLAAGYRAPQLVYDRLTACDPRGYFFEHAGKAMPLFRSAAVLAAHPAQRAARQADFRAVRLGTSK